MEENNVALVEQKDAVYNETDLPALIKDMNPPAGILPAVIEESKKKAEEIAGKILKAPDDRTSLRDALSLGEDIQSQSNQNFTLMRTSLGKVMDRMAKGEKNSIPDDLMSLRSIMDEINPYSAIEQLKKNQTAGWFSRVFGRIPTVGKILKQIAMKYESVQTQVDSIILSLNAGADKLLENTLEIEERYKNLKLLQNELKIRGWQLQIILAGLEEAKAKMTDPTGLAAVQKTSAKILRRLQNLKVTENAFSQFFITMNITMDNHENLREAVLSMANLTRPVLENGLALNIAQQDERKIAEALSASQEYLGKLMVNIAEDAMNNAALTAEVINSPLIKLQDLTKSYRILMNRMDEASKIENRMSESAKENIRQLEQMTADMESRAAAQETAREVLR